jgi:short-subunit dehydrogenase
MILARHPVAVTTVHPGGIKTGIARNATAAEGLDRDKLAKLFDKRLARTSPGRAAEVILDAVCKKKARVLVGMDAKVLDLMVRVAGPYYQQVFGPVLSRLRPRKQ